MSKSSQMVVRDRPLPFHAPQVEHVEPSEGLSNDAKKFWRSVMPELIEAGVLTTLDTPAFAQLSEAYSDWVGARRILAEEGRLLKRKKVIRETSQRAKDGRVRTFETVIDVTPIPHPALILASEADSRFRRWLMQFGMTPSSRIAMARRLVENGYEPPPIDLDELDREVTEELDREAREELSRLEVGANGQAGGPEYAHRPDARR